jgi:hypothetical protein
MRVARAFSSATDQAVRHRPRIAILSRAAGFVEKEQEHHIVGENDDLVGLLGLVQTSGNPIAMRMFERRDWAVEHDRELRLES